MGRSEKMTKFDKNEFLILKLLILYMPLHYIICEIILNMTSIDNILRDIVIILLFIMHVYRKGLKINIYGAIIFFMPLLMVGFMVVSLIQGNMYSINIFRTYVVPCLIYFIVKDLTIETEKIKKVVRIAIIEMCIIGVWGIFQAFVLGDDFLVKIGYPTVNGYLGAPYYINGYYGIQRSVGTFVSANSCGLIIAIFILLALLLDYYQLIKTKKYIIILLIGGMLATISRSAILSFLIALIYFFIICERRLSKKLIKSVLGIVLIGGTALMIFDSVVLKGQLYQMLKDALGSAVAFSDLSSQKHLSDLTESIHIILNNPLGLGFGYNGPMATEHVLNSRNVESSIYLMMYEMGPILGILYFVPFIRCVVKAPFIKNKIKKISASIILVFLVTCIFLPNVQTFEILFYMYLFNGIFDNNKLNTNVAKNKKLVTVEDFGKMTKPS